MHSINAYLNFMGNTEEAMNFYKEVLGGEFTRIQRYKEIPGGEKMSLADQEKLVHITLTTENGIVIMATDTLTSMGQGLTVGNNFYLCIQAESESEADRLMTDIAHGGKIEMPMNTTFWGAYFGMCQDKFGIKWMINYSYPKKA